MTGTGLTAEAGNACYNDWFLPAGNNSTATGQLNAVYTNRVAIGGFVANFYWSSTENSGNPANDAWAQSFGAGNQAFGSKSTGLPIRCVRAFTP